MDIDAVVAALISLATLAAEVGADIEELDINPLIVYPQGKGVRAVDALICL